MTVPAKKAIIIAVTILRDYNARKKVLKNIQNNVANLTEQFCSLRSVRIDAEIVKEKKMNEKKIYFNQRNKKN